MSAVLVILVVLFSWIAVLTLVTVAWRLTRTSPTTEEIALEQVRTPCVTPEKRHRELNGATPGTRSPRAA